MKPLKHQPVEYEALDLLPESDIRFEEDSEAYRLFAGRLEKDLAAMVDRWLHVSAPCAARSGLGSSRR